MSKSLVMIIFFMLTAGLYADDKPMECSIVNFKKEHLEPIMQMSEPYYKELLQVTSRKIVSLGELSSEAQLEEIEREKDNIEICNPRESDGIIYCYDSSCSSLREALLSNGTGLIKKVAVAQDKTKSVVGFALASKQPAKILALVTFPKGKGVGKKLLKSVEARLKGSIELTIGPLEDESEECGDYSYEHSGAYSFFRQHGYQSSIGRGLIKKSRS